MIHFRDNKIRSVSYVGNKSWRGPNLNGVRIGDSLERVTELLGTPSSISKSASEVSRIVGYANLKTFFLLEKNKIQIAGIFAPEFGPMRFAKDEDTEK